MRLLFNRRLPCSLGRFSATIAAIALLGGCSGNTWSTAPNGAAPASDPGHGFARARSVRFNAAACGKSVVYASSYNNSVEVFNEGHLAQGPCGDITGLSNEQGLFVDSKANLWVVNQGPHQVLEFAPGVPTPVLTLSDPAGYPVDVAVDNKSGTVYVTNFFNNGSAPGVVEVYAKGATSPTATLSDPSMQYAFYDAVDKKGNLYVTFLTSAGAGEVLEWTGGTGTAKNLGISLKAPGGIVTTASGALLICDQSAPACGDFAPGSTTMTNIFAQTDKDPFAIALSHDEGHAYVEDVLPHKPGRLEAWKYPGPDAHAGLSVPVPGGAYAGVAVSPAPPEGAPY